MKAAAAPTAVPIPKLATGFKSLDTIIQAKLVPGIVIELLTLDSYCDTSSLCLYIVCASAISNHLHNQSIRSVSPTPKSLKVLYIDTCNHMQSGLMIHKILHHSLSSGSDQVVDPVS